jgi:hypothetical protein
LEFICRQVATQTDCRIRKALATNLSDLLRYQNMLCRYDTMALKSLDVFSVHGFPIGFVHAESNLLGIRGSGTSTVVGSGGWLNITDKYGKAKAYCEKPFEIRHRGAAKVVVPIPGEHIGSARSHERGAAMQRKIALHCENAESCKLGDATIDAVFTDPPYLGNVQYAELMDFCYVWLRKLVGPEHAAFKGASTRNENELTGNANMGRGLEQFATGLSRIFRRMGKALKPGASLAFTFHHNFIEAYHAVAVAVLDSGLACTASIPCPAEMGASIHISGTGSSIVDTVLVCRSTGTVPRRSICDSPESVAELVRRDLDLLVRGHVEATKGDIRCIAAGHLTRLAIWFNRKTWDRTLPARERLSRVAAWIATLGGMDAVTRALESDYAGAAHLQRHQACEPEGTYAQVSF